MGDVAEHKLLLKKIEQTFPELDSAGCLRVYANVLKCVEKKHLVSSFVWYYKIDKLILPIIVVIVPSGFGMV